MNRSRTVSLMSVHFKQFWPFILNQVYFRLWTMGSSRIWSIRVTTVLPVNKSLFVFVSMIKIEHIQFLKIQDGTFILSVYTVLLTTWCQHSSVGESLNVDESLRTKWGNRQKWAVKRDLNNLQVVWRKGNFVRVIGHFLIGHCWFESATLDIHRPVSTKFLTLF